MYYCNKCGHMGEEGPGHHKPASYFAFLTPCDYDAVEVPDADKMPLQDVANLLARFLPEGWEVQMCIERGAGWVTLSNPNGDYVPLPDAGDKSLMQQLNDALSVAYGLATPNAGGKPTARQGRSA